MDERVDVDGVQSLVTEARKNILEVRKVRGKSAGQFGENLAFAVLEALN